MAEFIVFRTKDWPEVVRLLRCRSFWREDDLLMDLDKIIQMFRKQHGGSNMTDEDAAILNKLSQLLSAVTPHPDNPGRHYFQVDVAEHLSADDVWVLDQKAMEKLNADFIKQAGAVRPYTAKHWRDHDPRDIDEPKRKELLLLGLRDGVFKGMKAFPIPEEQA